MSDKIDTRKGYCCQLTKVINKVNQVIIKNQNTHAKNVYEYQLVHPLYEIQTITTKTHHLKSDECEKKKIISFCTLQALHVLTIKDSIMNIFQLKKKY